VAAFLFRFIYNHSSTYFLKGFSMLNITRVSGFILCFLAAVANAQAPAEASKNAEADPLSALRSKAAAGDLQAMHDLADDLDEGYSGAVNQPEALKWFEKAAAKGHIDSAARAGYMYDLAEGTEENNVRAAQLYLQAAKGGEEVAQFNLGLMYEDGEGVKQDLDRARFWYEKSAAQDYSGAIYSLALLYDNGTGVKQDNLKAIELYTKAAGFDNPSASYNLAVMYDNGEGIPEDDSKAIDFYTAAARLGHADATFNLGVSYRDGDGVKPQPARSYYWFTLAEILESEGADVERANMARKISAADKSKMDAQVEEFKERYLGD